MNEDSNYCFGEGGAGTYSDGKLYTRSKKRGDVTRILELLVAFGATPDILVDDYKFSVSGIYYSPTEGSLNGAVDYFNTLPIADAPEVFGMHENANVTFNLNESLSLMDAMLNLQPKSSGGGGGGTMFVFLLAEVEVLFFDPVCA